MINWIFAAIMGLGGGGLAYHSFTTPGALTIVNPGTVITGADPVLDTTGKTEVPCGPMTARTGVIVVIGQSLSVNSVPTPYTPVQANVDQINIWSGKCYKAQDPLLGINMGWADGHTYGSWMSRMADNLVAHGKFDRVVIVPMAVGNTRADQWASDTAAPYLKKNINVVALRLQNAGLACTAIMWGQGESDTSAGTSQAAYSASLAVIINEFKRAMPACPILIAQEAYYYGAINTAVLAAQAAAVNGTTVFAGENVELVPPSGRFDNTHLSDAGAVQRAALAEAALVTALGL